MRAAAAAFLVVALLSVGLNLLLLSGEQAPGAPPRVAGLPVALPAPPAPPAAALAPAAPAAAPAAPAGADGEELLEARPPRRLDALVLDAATSAPIASARVAVRRRGDEGAAVQGLVTDERGRVAFEDAPPGELELMAVAEGFVVAEEPVVVPADDHDVLVSLAPEAAPAARPLARGRGGCCDDAAAPAAPVAVQAGPCLDAQGRPFRGALGCDPEDPAHEPFEVALDAEGRPALGELPPGRWTLHLVEPTPDASQELRAWVLEVDVKPGQPVPVALDARGPRVRLEGVVRGAPAGDGLQVDVRPAAAGESFAFLAASVVDEQGRFAFPAVPPGRYLARATWDDGSAEAEVELREGVAGYVELTAP